MPVDKILMQIKDDHALTWPKLLYFLPNIHDKKKYSHFHKDQGHYMEDCRDLKEHLEELIQKRKVIKIVSKDSPSQTKQATRTRSDEKPRNKDRPQEHPRDAIVEILMINEGPTAGGLFKSLKKSQQRKVNSVHVTCPSKHRRRENLDMVF